MSALHPDYECKCQVPKEKVFLGQRIGLCTYCNGVYDHRLYESRLREHVKNLPEGADLHDILLQVDPRYQELNR